MSTFPGKQVCIIFVKWPEKGKVKTRLAKGSSEAFAKAFYKLSCEHVVAKLGRSKEWVCSIAFSPPDAEHAIQKWLNTASKGLSYIAQMDDPDLGKRMGGGMRACLSQGAEKVVLIGSDIPDIDEAIVQRAFLLLDSTEVVFGPAKDGGFYLVGGRVMPEAAMQGIEWSTSSVLAASTQKCAEAGVRANCHSLPVLQDIDTVEDLHDWLKHRDTDPLKEDIKKLIDGGQ